MTVPAKATPGIALVGATLLTTPFVVWSTSGLEHVLQGLLFLAYQRSLNRGFLAAQSRLDGEPLEDYVKPVGGGLFFVLPGPSQGDWLGESLLT